MSAEAFGESLLGEVKEESLDELLYEFNKTYGHGKHTSLGIEPLDELLRIFHGGPDHPPRSDRGHLSDRTVTDPGKRRTEADRETVLEITSPSSSCGKSHLLYYMIAVAILPTSFNDIPLRGADSAVVFFDTDGRFDVCRLRDIMTDIVRQKSQALAESIEGGGIEGEELQSMIRHCLHHVHLFRPQSSESLLSTLGNLEDYLLHSSDHLSANRPLHAIFLDSANAFYWQDRFQEEISRLSSPSTATQHNRRPHAQAIKLSLIRLQKMFSCAVVYTTWGLSAQSRHQASVLSFPPWLPDFPTLRIVVDRDTIRPFGSDMTLNEALREAPARHAMVSKGKFSGWVNPWEKNEWASNIPEMLRRTEGKGEFSFWITKEGVAFHQR